MATVKEILLRAQADTGRAQAAVHSLSDEIRDVPTGTTANIKVRQIGDNLQKLREELRKIDRTKASPEVNVKVTKALVDIDRLFARLEALPSRKTIDIDVRRGLAEDLGAIERAVFGVGKSLGSAVEGGGRSFSQWAGDVAQNIKSLTPIVNGLGIVLLTALVPGLIALAGAAGGAVTAMGALATGLAGAALPAAGLLSFVMNRLSKVMEAYKAVQANRLDQDKRAADGTTAAAEAADKRRSAENALRDALQARASAERGVEEARRSAGEAIVASERRVASAQQGVGDAQQTLTQAWIDGYRAMYDAAEQVRDGILDVQDAQLGIERAALTTKQAEQALKDYLTGLGKAPDEIDAFFQKFKDVDVNVGTLATSVTGDPKDQLGLEDLILRVKEAKQGEKHATDDLADSETALGRAREDNAKFLRGGVQAYQPLVAAQRALRGAQQELADATKENVRLERLGIRNAPAVVAAQEALRNAIERTVEARRKLGEVRADKGLTATQQKAQALLKNLSGAERSMVRSLQFFSKNIGAVFGDASDKIIGALARGLRQLPGMLKGLKPDFDLLGDAGVSAFNRIGKSLFLNLGRFKILTDGAAVILDLFGRLGAAGLTAFTTLAVAALPSLIKMLNAAAGAVERFASGLSVGGAGSFISRLMPVLTAVVHLAIQLGAALGEAFVAVAPYARQLVNFITAGVKQFRRWMASTKGKGQIKQFFEDTIPLVKSILKFVVALGKGFLVAFQALSPVLKPIVDMFTSLVGIVTWILGLFGKIPAPIREVIGVFASFFIGGKIFTTVGRIIQGFGGVVARIFPRIGGWIGKVGKAFSWIGEKILGFGGSIAKGLVRPFEGGITRVINLARGFGGRIVGGIRTAARALLGAGKWVVQKILAGIRGYFRFIFNIGETVVRRYLEGLRSVAMAIYNAGRWVVGRVIAGVRSLFNNIVGIGSWLLQGLIKGFTTIGRWVWDALKGLGGRIVDAVKSILGISSPSKVMYGLGQHMLAGLIKGMTDGDVRGFIKHWLGSIPKLALELGLDVLELPVKLAKGAIGAVGDVAGALNPFASGGLVRGGRGGVGALIGEQRHDEAVLPLTSGVMRRLAAALASQLRFPTQPAFGPAAALAGPRGFHIENLNLPPAPGHDQLGDPRVQAVQLARELARRGGGGPSL